METSEDMHRGRGKTLRAPVILARLKQVIDDPTIALHYRDHWELLIATMLSAQSTDKKVNEITPALFAAFPGPEGFASADLVDIEVAISSLGLYRQKAKNAQATARLLLERHGGEVPADMDALIALPGVARKTANVVLSNAFGINEGVVVDTHVMRLATRLGFTRETTPPKVERDLMRLVPREQWLELADLLIHHGRITCDALRPKCDDCAIENLCPSSAVANKRDKARQRKN